MTAPDPFRFFLNPRHGVPGVVVLPESGFRRAAAEIRSWPGHAPSPLLPRPAMAETLGLAAVHVKQAASAGGAYALTRLVRAETARRGQAADDPRGITIICADGDEDDAHVLAREAARLGVPCVAFVRDSTRWDTLRKIGAGTRVARGGIEEAAAEAGRGGWHLVSGTARPGYTEVPRDVMQGHRLLAEEALDALPAPPTHVFVPGGAGGLAAAVAVHLRARCGTAPRVVVTEPARDARLLAMAEGRVPEVMPSLLAWQELERSAFAFLVASDPASGLKDAATDSTAREAFGLDGVARVLLFADTGASSELHRTAKPSS